MRGKAVKSEVARGLHGASKTSDPTHPGPRIPAFEAIAQQAIVDDGRGRSGLRACKGIHGAIAGEVTDMDFIPLPVDEDPGADQRTRLRRAHVVSGNVGGDAVCLCSRAPAGPVERRISRQAQCR